MPGCTHCRLWMRGREFVPTLHNVDTHGSLQSFLSLSHPRNVPSSESALSSLEIQTGTSPPHCPVRPCTGLPGVRDGGMGADKWCQGPPWPYWAVNSCGWGKAQAAPARCPGSSLAAGLQTLS